MSPTVSQVYFFVLPLSFFMAMLSFFFRIGHLAFYRSMEKMQPFRMVNSSATQHLFKPRSRRRSAPVFQPIGG